MANELQSLSSLFQNRLFRIPDYQRGYAWGLDQLVDFWEDLMNLHEDRFHYTGLLSLRLISKIENKNWDEEGWLIENGYQSFHVVDGQQRLTTFSILINEIVEFIRYIPEHTELLEKDIFLGYESLSDISAKYILRKLPPHNIVRTYLFGYETDHPSDDYLKYRIYGEEYEGEVFETFYTKNLRFAKEFFSDNLRALFDSEGIDGICNLYRKLTLKLMFNIHEIQDDYDVFVAFETMNNRGKKLTNLELLKNRLIYLTTLFDEKQLDDINRIKLRKTINSAWKEIYRQLGRNQNTPLSDNEFLRAHWIIYFQYTRKKGDDYIKFLLDKFSAKNIYDKYSIIERLVSSRVVDEVIPFDTEDEDNEGSYSVPNEISKLSVKDFNRYIQSLKALAQFWYYSFFPNESTILADEEIVLIDRLNRLGIGYFRPLVTAVLAKSKDTEINERVDLFKAIERFIFLNFRLAGYNSTYKSAENYNNARAIMNGKLHLPTLTKDLNVLVDKGMDSLITSFITRTDRRFDAGDGFYGWNDLRYFLYEYEYELSIINKLKKVDWSMFARTEKDKVTIEHILPQTPSKWYWRNQFRQFSGEEIKLLSISLGNLLPLSQSVNSSLQNDSFYDKKNPASTNRRGYVNGSHSEIEVSFEEDWDVIRILSRGIKLLKFMSKRWCIPFTDEQIARLLHIEFVNDERTMPPVLEEESKVIHENNPIWEDSESKVERLEFWKDFVNYCNLIGRNDVSKRKPNGRDWYDISADSNKYHLFLQIIRNNKIRVGVYVYEKIDFEFMQSKKSEIEGVYGSPLEWNKSRKGSKAKRIFHTKEVDVYNHELCREHFDWMINHYTKLRSALKAVEV